MKNILNKFKVAFLLLVSSLIMQSCLLDDDVTDFGTGPVLVQFSNLTASQNFLQTEANTVYEYDIPVSIFGGRNVALDRDVDFTVSTSSESTATEGVEFNFLGGKSFTIPAGSLQANVKIEVLAENLDSANPPTLVLQIDSSSEAVSDINTTKIVLQAICPSNLAGAYEYTNLPPGAYPVTVTETGAGTYSVSRDNYFGGSYAFNISDVCGVITITGGTLTDSFGIATEGGGTVDADTGIITFTYTADGYFSNRTMTLVPQ